MEMRTGSMGNGMRLGGPDCNIEGIINMNIDCMKITSYIKS